MIVALLNQQPGVGKTTPAPHFAGQACRQEKRIGLIDADPQGAEPDWSEEGVLRHCDRLIGGVSLVRDMPDRDAAGLARDPDHIVVEEALHAAALPGPALVQRDLAVADMLRNLLPPNFSTPMESAHDGRS